MLRVYPRFIAGPGALGFLALRVVIGAAFILHGMGKIEHATEWMNKMADSPPPPYLQAAAAYSEVIGGGALIVGLLTPLAALALIGVMVGALTYHLQRGDKFVAVGNPSWELAAVYFAGALLFL